jgi:hypothetical protein
MFCEMFVNSLIERACADCTTQKQVALDTGNGSDQRIEVTSSFSTGSAVSSKGIDRVQL